MMWIPTSNSVTSDISMKSHFKHFRPYKKKTKASRKRKNKMAATSRKRNRGKK